CPTCSATGFGARIAVVCAFRTTTNNNYYLAILPENQEIGLNLVPLFGTNDEKETSSPDP
ncbi:MAG: hypothetical protein K2F93_06765, partial [Muribaculaceae bacterium]|nr:hypothetical protein [Muribaculaceae bacterium]